MQRTVPDQEGAREGPVGSLVLGRYRPLRPLGSGGSGSVWLVRDEHEGREVALKVVPRTGKPGARAEREVQAAARLRHPRCLRALALARDDDHVYVAYEYVRGKTLREALRRGELDDAAAIEAGAQILEALAHAHAKGVVHRDVKPANVMLDADGEEPVSVLLLDFGLAHLDGADTLTAAGDVPGTLAYIAPERLGGERASAAADVWSVGVVLWEALTGWHPFAAASPLETARRIEAGAAPLARSRPDLPRPLCALVDRMLAPDPRKRPPAKRLPAELRAAADQDARRPRPATARRTLRERAAHAALAGALTAGSTLLLPFFPRGWPLGLAAAVALVALRSPRAGLALALAAPVLPLANVSLGLALAYLPLALAWLLFAARDAANGLLFVAGPLLAPVGGLALVPVLAARARGAARRAAHAALAVATAAVAAGLSGGRLPLTGAPAPAAAPADPGDGAAAAALGVARLLAAQPALALEMLVFAAAALAVPLARRYGAWGAAVWGSAFLAAALLAPPLAGAGAVAAFPLTAAAWIGTAVLARSALLGQR